MNNQPDKIRVRIERCSKPTYWYSDKIGQEFDVEDDGGAVYYPPPGDPEFAILKSDCTILPPEDGIITKNINMKSGIELIAEERQEQIEKHGFDVGNDLDYSENELLKAALFCINPDVFEWPFDWGEKFRYKIKANDEMTRLKKAGAFIAAQIDRLQKIKS